MRPGRCYFRPFAMLILLAGTYLILSTLLFPNVEPDEMVNVTVGEQSLTAESLFGTTLKDVLRHPAAASLFMLFSIVWVTPWFFRRHGGRRYNYVEYLFIGAYMASRRFWVDIALLPYKLIPESSGWPDVELWLALAYLGLTAWDYKQFFGLRWRKAIPKTIGLTVLAFLIALIPGILILVSIAAAGMASLLKG